MLQYDTVSDIIYMSKRKQIKVNKQTKTNK